MKKVRLILLAVVAMLFLDIGNVSAQEKSVLIRGYFSPYEYKISTIQPDYEVSVNEIKRAKNSTEEDFLILVKKELDKWLIQGYVITEFSVLKSDMAAGYSQFYTLTKKE